MFISSLLLFSFFSFLNYHSIGISMSTLFLRSRFIIPWTTGSTKTPFGGGLAIANSYSYQHYHLWVYIPVSLNTKTR